MTCKHDNCTAPAAQLVTFPWSEPGPMCEQHVAQARQLMGNLGRLDELKVGPLDAEYVDAPPPVPVSSISSSSTESELLTEREKAWRVQFERELELERLKCKRVADELELLGRLERLVAAGAKYFDELLADKAEQRALIEELEGRAPKAEPAAQAQEPTAAAASSEPPSDDTAPLHDS